MKTVQNMTKLQGLVTGSVGGDGGEELPAEPGPAVAEGESSDEEHGERASPRVTSSVLFVSRLECSIAFYQDVFSCTVSFRESGAALLLAPDGFQLYLIARGTRAEHPVGGLGHQYLIWAVHTDAELRALAAVLRDRVAHTDEFTSGGVSFVAAPDPDGIRVLVAHPHPEKLARSVVAPRLYT